MKSRTGRAALVLLFLLSGGCGTRTANTGSGRADRNLITMEQMRERRFTNAYEAVQALHANWLQTKGTDSFNSPSQVQVYVDDTRYGGVETLRTITTNSISYIRYYDGIAATGRWGIDHGQGVIFVSTRPRSNAAAQVTGAVRFHAGQ